MNAPENLRYTKDHEWIRVEGTFGWIGITEYAQGELGDIVYVELPAPGTKLQQGKTFGTIDPTLEAMAAQVRDIDARLEKGDHFGATVAAESLKGKIDPIVKDLDGMATKVRCKKPQ